MKLSRGEKGYLQVISNNKNYVAKEDRSLRSRWNFVPNEERKRTIEMYPIMHTGALGIAMQEFLEKKRRKQEALKKLHKLIQAKKSQVVTNGG